MLNQCQFIGHMGADPEIRTMGNSGERVANFSLGVSEKWKDRDGNRQEKTEWVRCVAFGGVVDVLEKYTRKGSKVYVAGKWTTRQWEDREGVKKYSTEYVLSKFDGKLILLDSKGQSDGQNRRGDYDRNQDTGGSGVDNERANFDLDDEIPFS